MMKEDLLTAGCHWPTHDERRSGDCRISPQLETLALNEEYSVHDVINDKFLVFSIQAVETACINIKNKTGPRTGSCGTPLKRQSGLKSNYPVYCSLSSINADIA